jgi:putative ABC transport system substrate-binding protein
MIPIVATEFGTEPVKAGLVASLGRPEGNVTGLATLSDELWQKRLGLLKEIAPKVSQIWVLWNPANPGNAACVEQIKATAAALRLEVLPLEVRDASTLQRAFAMMGTPAAQRPSAMPSKSTKAAAPSGQAAKAESSPDRDLTTALTACWDSVLLERARAIADFALERHLATVAPLKEYVDEGFLMSLGISLPPHRRRAAYYVNKILKGAKPAELPVEQATLFELVVNLKTARALGLTPPPQMIANADDVIR